MSLIVPNFETNKLERRFMTKVQNNYENYLNPKNVIEKIRNTQIKCSKYKYYRTSKYNRNKIYIFI